MSPQRNALGRGLGALIPGADKPESGGAGSLAGKAARDQDDKGAPRPISVDLIDPNPDQPRRVFDPSQLHELAESIRLHGVLQPIVVRSSGGRFELLVGERRWRATRLAGLPTVPAVVADVAPSARLELAIVENVQRHDLNPMELAHAYRALAERGATQEEIGQRVGKDRSSIANHLRLLELSKGLQEDVEGGRLSMGHAKALLQIANPERRRHIRDRVINEGLSVRDVEALARDGAAPRSRGPARGVPKAPAGDPSLAALVDELARRFQTRVRIQGDAKKGRIELDYSGSEELERLLEMMLEPR